MVFTSHVFLFYFLPLVLAVYYLLPFRARTALIAVSSYVFYGWANPIWAAIMFFGSSVDYVCGIGLLKLSGLPDEPGGLPPVIGREVPRTRAMKALLVDLDRHQPGPARASSSTRASSAENVNALGRLLGVGHDLVPVLHIVLPVGISFYTFKAMSYAIDVYRGDARPMRRFIDFLCFEAFFPDLVAGPIIRYAALEEQMRVRAHTLEKFARGVAFFAFGMAKKILHRQPDGPRRRHGVRRRARCTRRDAWFGLLGYAFQIYFDFSGYSDMAVGLALMLGFVLIQNFDSPYQAESITDFWRRWHITLSTWLRDYLYIPLGGNRLGAAAHLRQPDGRDAARRALARRELELRDLGRDSRRHAGVRALAGASESLYRRLPRAAADRDHVLRRLSLLGLLPREDARASAGDVSKSLFGVAAVTAASDASRGTDVHAAITSPCSSSRRSSSGERQTPGRSPPGSSAPRALAALGLLALSILMMWTQSANPFLYFQF